MNHSTLAPPIFHGHHSDAPYCTLNVSFIIRRRPGFIVMALNGTCASLRCQRNVRR